MVYGPDVSIGTDYWELNLQYLYREDDNVNFDPAAAPKTKTQGGFAELTIMPNADQSLFLFTLLYNRIDSDDKTLDYETATLSFSHMAARNVRLLLEFTYDLIDEKKEISGQRGHRLTFGAVTAF
jgi:hypothetical protein